MSESSFWTYLRKRLPKGGHYTRIESHDTATGFPDVHYTYHGNSGTIELKDAKRPGAKFPFRRESELRKSQLDWIRDEVNTGGRVLLALQCGDRVYLLDAEYCYRKLRNMTEDQIDAEAVVRWRKGQKADAEDEYPIETQLRDLLECTR